MMFRIILLIASSATAVLSQILFKRSVNAVGGTGSSSYAHLFIELLKTPGFLIALFAYGISFILWVVLLTRSSLSVVYPIALALNVTLALVIARMVLGETLHSLQIFGVGLILV